MSQSSKVTKSFASIQINGQQIYTNTAGSLSVGGTPVGGEGGGVTATTSFTSANRLALFDGTSGNHLIDTAIYHSFNEDNSAILSDPSDMNRIYLSTGEITLSHDGVNELRISDSGIGIYSSNVNFDGNPLKDVGAPQDPTDAATKQYVDSLQSLKTTITLTPSDIQNLHVYPGKRLVEGVNNYNTIIEGLEFYRAAQLTGYTAANVNFYLNNSSNSVDVTKNYTWKFPADAQQNGGEGLLSSLFELRGYAYPTGYTPLGPGTDINLMADNPITGTGGNLLVRVTYKLEPSDITQN